MEEKAGSGDSARDEAKEKGEDNGRPRSGMTVERTSQAEQVRTQSPNPEIQSEGQPIHRSLRRRIRRTLLAYGSNMKAPSD